MLKRLGKSIDVKHVLPMLGDVKYIEWRSLAILLLAQRDEPEYRRQIISSSENAERFRLPMNLAA
jgi:hypothetical protein